MSNEQPVPEESIPEETTPEQKPAINNDEKLLAAVSYFFIVAIVLLLMEDQKKKAFVRYHAVQSLAVNVVLAIIAIILGFIPVIQCLTPIIWLVLLWPAFDAYNGNYTKIPFVTDFIRKQGWIS